MRRLFAFFEVNECNGDFATVDNLLTEPKLPAWCKGLTTQEIHTALFFLCIVLFDLERQPGVNPSTLHQMGPYLKSSS